MTLLLQPGTETELEAFTGSLLARDLTIEHIYLRVFQPAARCLGEMWVEDTCSFVDVTLATAALQSALRRLAPQFQRQAEPLDDRRSILLATLDNDQHTFGINMAAEFFRRAGWIVSVVIAADADGIVGSMPVEGRFVVGLSASRLDQVPVLTRTVARLRRAGRSRLAGVLVGGPLVAESPAAATAIGADALGHDAWGALAQAEGLAAVPEGLS